LQVLGTTKDLQHAYLFRDHGNGYGQIGKIYRNGLIYLQWLPAMGAEHFKTTHDLYRQGGKCEARKVRSKAVCASWHKITDTIGLPVLDQCFRITNTGKYIQISHHDLGTDKPCSSATDHGPWISAATLQIRQCDDECIMQDRLRLSMQGLIHARTRRFRHCSRVWPQISMG